MRLSEKQLQNSDITKKEGWDDEYGIYTNDGKTDTDIYTFVIKNKNPYIISGTHNNFEASFTHMKRNRNFKDYYDMDNDNKVVYNGNIIEIGDLSVVDFYSKNSFKFSHNVKIKNFTVSNFISYADKSDALIRGYDSTKKMSSYQKVKIPSHTTWDMRISYNQNLYNNIKLFANLDINNILNKNILFTKIKTMEKFTIFLIQEEIFGLKLE